MSGCADTLERQHPPERSPQGVQRRCEFVAYVSGQVLNVISFFPTEIPRLLRWSAKARSMAHSL